MNITYIKSSFPGIVVKISVASGEYVTSGQELVILEAMKMENAITAPCAALIQNILISEGQVVNKGDILFEYQSDFSESQISKEVRDVVDAPIESSLKELRTRKALLTDEARPEAENRRVSKGQNTIRQNIEQLVDPDSFKEYGGYVIAAQQSRRSMDDLLRNTPADGLVSGRGHINGESFTDHTECVIMGYDYTVLAGTQGTMNHMKMDRMISLAKDLHLPVILFAEGGGGRPGDVDVHTIAGLYISTFVEFASLKNVVPTISIVSGYCFAGNAALAGSSDLIIGTKNISLGMGGPAMISGGGLGDFHPREVGPAHIHTQNGVIDVLAEHESEAIQIAKKYLGYWQGRRKNWEEDSQLELQNFIPENRKRTFNIRHLIKILADRDSLLELRPEYASGLITCLARINGIPIGIIANNSEEQAGAITASNARKAADFLDKCDGYSIPVISLIDTPGIMVGPEAEKEGTVRAAGALFVSGANFKPPFLSIVLRRAYGLGAMAMMGGSTRASDFTISWPTGEFGAMGLEGAVQLGYRKELEAIKDEEARAATYNKMVEEAYERGKALSMATMFEIDDVIEPKDTRSWILSGINFYNRNT